MNRDTTGGFQLGCQFGHGDIAPRLDPADQKIGMGRLSPNQTVEITGIHVNLISAKDFENSVLVSTDLGRNR